MFLVEEIPTLFIKSTGNIKEMDYPRQGYTSEVAFINGDFVVKKASGLQNRTMLHQEITHLQWLNETNLPTAKCIEVMNDEEHDETWALMTRLQGETLRSAILKIQTEKQREVLIESFGLMLAKIHATPCPNHLKTADAWLQRKLKQATYNLQHASVDGNAQLLQRLQQTQPTIMKQTLIHGDFTLDNLLVHNGKVSSIIDWGGATYGDPNYDIALAIRPKPGIFENSNDLEYFLKGYGKHPFNEQLMQYYQDLYEFF